MAVNASRGFLQRKSWSQGSHLPRFEAIRPYVEGKSVLDVGCVSGHWRNDWLHGLISSVSREVVGVDLDREAIDKLNARGFSFVHGNAESLNLGRKFDVVFAGEIIEHLTCFRGFFESMREHLTADGRLVLTTPNAFGVSNFVYRLWGQARVHPEHTCWFCSDTLKQLLERHRFEVVSSRCLHFETVGFARRLLAHPARALLPEHLAWNTLLVVAKPV
jgi:2-polyprenyl-3-methyl-5-hydroxy-6-metoxy-1,4-benzoquinol methylase